MTVQAMDLSCSADSKSSASSGFIDSFNFVTAHFSYLRLGWPLIWSISLVVCFVAGKFAPLGSKVRSNIAHNFDANQTLADCG